MKAIITKFHGPTYTKGSRISATDDDGNRVMTSSNHALSSDDRHDAAALALCRKMGWKGRLVRGWLKNRVVYVFLNDHNVLEIPAEK
jgi:hypothetical protein